MVLQGSPSPAPSWPSSTLMVVLQWPLQKISMTQAGLGSVLQCAPATGHSSDPLPAVRLNKQGIGATVVVVVGNVVVVVVVDVVDVVVVVDVVGVGVRHGA